MGKKTLNRGFITIQFLLAFIIVMFFVQSFIGLSLTLTHGSLTQYLTYSAARKLSLGAATKSSQIFSAEEKYSSLRRTFFKSHYKGNQDWFKIPLEVSSTEVGFNNNYESTQPYYRDMFYGVFIPFESRVLNFQIPFLTEENNQNLKTEIGSYLGREPSQRECQLFFKSIVDRVCRTYGLDNCQGEVRSNNGC